MTESSRETKLSAAFVTLADTLVARYDAVDLMQVLVDTCVDVLDVSASGVLLRSGAGDLHVVASSTEEAAFLEIVQVDARSGPCWECVQSGLPQTVPSIDATADRWPAFHDAAVQRGFHSMQSTPLRLRDTVVGAMNLYSTAEHALSAADIAAAQALSDVATIGILTERAARERELITAQLEHALGSRVVIEQAKGFLAQTFGITTDEAFSMLRSAARSRGRGLTGLARSIVDRQVPAAELRAALPVDRPGSERGRR